MIIKHDSTFLNALAGKNEKHLPVWFMRQAGRYLPEYMATRATSSFRKMSHDAEIMKDITIQPLRRYPVDAAIMFSDILTCLEFMGSTFHFGDGGPTLENPGPAALTGLTKLNPQESMKFVGDGIKRIVSEIQERPLIGFVGAPFTLASYLIEGGSSREFSLTRKFMLEEPKKFRAAQDLLADSVGNYLCYQIDCGVKAVQIFDSWGGFLSLSQYREWILPSIQRLIKIVKTKNVPIILYTQPTSHLLPALAESGATALSVDWRLEIKEYAERLKSHGAENLALQGNIDPIVMTLDWEKAKPHIDAVLRSAQDANILSRFVFNVGHGFTPMTNPETVAHVVDYVHAFRKNG